MGASDVQFLWASDHFTGRPFGSELSTHSTQSLVSALGTAPSFSTLVAQTVSDTQQPTEADAGASYHASSQNIAAEVPGAEARCSSPHNGLRVPRAFLCPVTCALLRDPVVVRLAGGKGLSVEREVVEAWLELRGKATGPNASPDITASAAADLVPNTALRDVIDEWLLDHDLDHQAADTLLPVPPPQVLQPHAAAASLQVLIAREGLSVSLVPGLVPAAPASRAAQTPLARSTSAAELSQTDCSASQSALKSLIQTSFYDKQGNLTSTFSSMLLSGVSTDGSSCLDQIPGCSPAPVPAPYQDLASGWRATGTGRSSASHLPDAPAARLAKLNVPASCSGGGQFRFSDNGGLGGASAPLPASLVPPLRSSGAESAALAYLAGARRNGHGLPSRDQTALRGASFLYGRRMEPADASQPQPQGSQHSGCQQPPRQPGTVDALPAWQSEGPYSGRLYPLSAASAHLLQAAPNHESALRAVPPPSAAAARSLWGRMPPVPPAAVQNTVDSSGPRTPGLRHVASANNAAAMVAAAAGSLSLHENGSSAAAWRRSVSLLENTAFGQPCEASDEGRRSPPLPGASTEPSQGVRLGQVSPADALARCRSGGAAMAAPTSPPAMAPPIARTAGAVAGSGVEERCSPWRQRATFTYSAHAPAHPEPPRNAALHLAASPPTSGSAARSPSSVDSPLGVAASRACSGQNTARGVQGSDEQETGVGLPLRWLSERQLEEYGLAPRDDRQQVARLRSWLAAAPAPACRDLFTLQRCGGADADVLRCWPVAATAAHSRVTSLAVLLPALPQPQPAAGTLPFPFTAAAGLYATGSASPSPTGSRKSVRFDTRSLGGTPPGPFAVMVCADRPRHVLVEELNVRRSGSRGGGAGRCWTLPTVLGRVTCVAVCPRGGSIAVGTSAGLVFVWRLLEAADSEGEGSEGGGSDSAEGLDWQLCGRLGWPAAKGAKEMAAQAKPCRAGSQSVHDVEWPEVDLSSAAGRRTSRGAGAAAQEGGSDGEGGGSGPPPVTALAYDGGGSTLLAARGGVLAGWRLLEFRKPERSSEPCTKPSLVLSPEDYGCALHQSQRQPAAAAPSGPSAAFAFAAAAVAGMGIGGGGSGAPSQAPASRADRPMDICSLVASPGCRRIVVALADGSVYLVHLGMSREPPVASAPAAPAAPADSSCERPVSVRLLPPAPPALAALGHPVPGAAVQMALSADERSLVVLALGLRPAAAAAAAAEHRDGDRSGEGSRGGAMGWSGSPRGGRGGGVDEDEAEDELVARYAVHVFPLTHEALAQHSLVWGPRGSDHGGREGADESAEGLQHEEREGGGAGEAGACDGDGGGAEAPDSTACLSVCTPGELRLDWLPVPPQNSRGRMLTGLALAPDGASAVALDTARRQLLFADLTTGTATTCQLVLGPAGPQGPTAQQPAGQAGAGAGRAGGYGRQGCGPLRPCSCLAVLPGGRELLLGGESGLLRWRAGP